MAFIKIGIRNNLLYPCIFLLLIILERGIRYILEDFLNSVKLIVLLPTLQYCSDFLFGLFYICCSNITKKKIRKNSVYGVELITNEQEINKLDNDYKIILLIILSAFFDVNGILRRKYMTTFETLFQVEHIEIRIRSREVIISSLLYYLTLKKQLYKHHKFTLIIIFICLIVNIILEFFRSNYKTVIMHLILMNCISIFRVFVDIIEKYLFEYDYLDLFKLLRFKGFMAILFISPLYISKINRKEIEYFLDMEKDYKFILSILLLVLFFFLSGVKTVYRLYTVKFYSPTTRAFIDSILDIFVIIYNNQIKPDHKGKKDIYFIIDLISTIIMVLCSLIYNDFLVLNFCGLDHDTYLEISKRAVNIELFTNDNQNDESILNQSLN